MKTSLRILGQAVLLTVLASGIGLLVNLVRSEGLPLVASKPYQVLVPCPVVTQEAPGVAIEELGEIESLLIVDARPLEQFEESHLPGAVSLPFHPIKEPSDEQLAGLRSRRAAGILVYGDDQVDCGRLLGAELVGKGLPRVRYLKGGFPAWVKAGRETVGGDKP